MKKYIPLLIALFSMILFSILIIFVANINKTENLKKEKESEIEKEKEEEKIFELAYSDKRYLPYLEKAALEYEKKYGKTIKLKYRQSINYLENINEDSKDENAVDLFVMKSEDLQNAVLLGISEETNYKDIYSEKNYSKTAIDATSYLGKNYGYPLGFDTAILMYNKKVIKAEPKTITEISEFAASFDNANYPEVESVIKWDVTKIILNYHFIGAYLNLGGVEGDNPDIIDVDGDNIKNAAAFYQKLSQFFYINPEKDNDDLILENFYNGKIAYTFASVDSLKKGLESKEDIGYMPIPDMDKNLKSKPLSLTDLVMVNPFSDQKSEARKFAKFITYEMADEMYADAGIISTKLHKYKNEALNIFIKAYSNSAMLPKLMTTTDYWIKINNILEKIWTGSDVNEIFTKLKEELYLQIN